MTLSAAGKEHATREGLRIGRHERADVVWALHDAFNEKLLGKGSADAVEYMQELDKARQAGVEGG